MPKQPKPAMVLMLPWRQKILRDFWRISSQYYGTPAPHGERPLTTEESINTLRVVLAGCEKEGWIRLRKRTQALLDSIVQPTRRRSK